MELQLNPFWILKEHNDKLCQWIWAWWIDYFLCNTGLKLIIFIVRSFSILLHEANGVDRGHLFCFLVAFSNPVWKFDYTFSRKYPSRNKFINADRIDKLNQELISQTDGTYWKTYIQSTTANYQTGSYDRLPLYCIMRYVFEEDFKKCHEKFKVLGG